MHDAENALFGFIDIVNIVIPVNEVLNVVHGYLYVWVVTEFWKGTCASKKISIGSLGGACMALGYEYIGKLSIIFSRKQ